MLMTAIDIYAADISSLCASDRSLLTLSSLSLCKYHLADITEEFGDDGGQLNSL